VRDIAACRLRPADAVQPSAGLFKITILHPGDCIMRNPFQRLLAQCPPGHLRAALTLSEMYYRAAGSPAYEVSDDTYVRSFLAGTLGTQYADSLFRSFDRQHA
jgi:hypothetical protein